MRRRELASVLALGLLPFARDDAAVQLRSAKVDERLAGVEKLKKDGGKDAEALLRGVLKDADWEVVEKATAALAERGSAASAEALAKLALDAPARRLRLAAARAMAKLDPAAAATAFMRAAKLDSPGAIATFAKGTRQPSQTLAIDAMANTVDLCGEPVRTAMAAAISDKEDAYIRSLAAAGIMVFTGDERVKRLKECLDDEYSEVATGALGAFIAKPDPATLPTLLDALVKKDQRRVIERWIDRAIVALLVATPSSERAAVAAPVVEALKSAKGPAQLRVVRALALCAAKPAEAIAADAAVAALAPLLKEADEATRAAAMHALAQVGGDAALDAVAGVVHDEKTARLRDLALRDLLAARGIQHAATRELVNGLANDPDAEVREDAIAALGTPDAAGAVELLTTKLKDSAWEVVVAAAVSLGRTHDAAALAPLEAQLASKDWKVASAALAGLGRLRQKNAVPRLIEGLKSKSATARATALDELRRLTPDKVAPKEQAWKEWWQKKSATFEFPDSKPKAKEGDKEKSAGAREDEVASAYADLDVLCFQGRFEKIEKLLDAQKIAHRDTKTSAIDEAGVTPLGVVFVDCAGDALPPDLEQMRWFVHAGGLLVCSCKAFVNQAAEIRHGFVRQLTNKGDALDLVAVDACRDDEGMAPLFRESARPRFALVDAPMIELVDPERVDVLLDSAECESEWDGGAILATWTVGHGRVVACVAHLDSPGLACQQAPPMKDAADRMGYALDTMDYGFADLRAIPAEIWKSGNKSAEEARDLGPFRAVTGVVRRHRREQD